MPATTHGLRPRGKVLARPLIAPVANLQRVHLVREVPREVGAASLRISIKLFFLKRTCRRGPLAPLSNHFALLPPVLPPFVRERVPIRLLLPLPTHPPPRPGTGTAAPRPKEFAWLRPALTMVTRGQFLAWWCATMLVFCAGVDVTRGKGKPSATTMVILVVSIQLYTDYESRAGARRRWGRPTPQSAPETSGPRT